MEISHLVWSTVGRQPFFASDDARRATLHALAAVAGGYIVVFALVDDHVHIIIVCPPERRAALQASLTRVLAARACTPLAVAHRTPVTRRAHLESLVAYCLKQPGHHGLPGHPALAVGSCFADIVGARRVPGLALQLPLALPRYRLREAYAAVGLTTELNPASDAELRDAGPAAILRAAAYALAQPISLSGNAPEIVRARRAALQLTEIAGLPGAVLAHTLGITPRAALRLAAAPADPAAHTAARLHLSLQVACASAPPPKRALAASFPNSPAPA